MLSISLSRTFGDQGPGYPLRVHKIALKLTGPVKILTKGPLRSKLLDTPVSAPSATRIPSVPVLICDVCYVVFNFGSA